MDQSGLWWLIVICQLEQATGYPDVWPSIILGVSVRVLLNEINIKSAHSVKQMAFHYVSEPYSII